MAKRRQPSQYHVSIYDYKDTDLMAHLASTSTDGMSSHEIAQEMGLVKNEEDDGAQSVGVRLSWMRRFGMVAFDGERKLWTLTDGAERVMEAQKIAAMTRTIEAVPDESMVEVMAHVTSRYRLGDPMMAALLRREFQYGTSPRSRAWR